jgi:hypothetical protein
MEKLSEKYKKSEVALDHNMNGHNGHTPEQNYINQQVQKRVSARQPNITIVCGMTGVGKSYTVIQEVLAYIKDNPANGKKGRPAFIFDTNMEDEYAQMFPRTVTLDTIPNIVNPECRRILPFNPDGSFMNDEDMRRACVQLGRNLVWNGLLVLDDYDKYCSGSAKTRDMTVLFMSNRHRGQDLILIHQSLGMVSRIELRNATLFRLHKCTDSVDTIKDRFPNYSIIKIAELIIWEQFQLAEEKKHLMTEKEYMKRRSFFLYINIRTDKIIGNISKECFIRNCKKFIKLNPEYINNYISLYLDGNKNAMSRDEISSRIIQNDFMRYYTPPKVIV